jgi:hypothetical protein
MLTRKRIRRGVLVSVWLAVAACSSSACNSSDNSTMPGVSDGSALADATGSTMDANLPIMEMNDSASSPPAQAIVCGGMMCTAPSGGMIPLTSCCLPDMTCGANLDLSGLGGLGGIGPPTTGGDGGGGAGCLDTSPGTMDPSCPSQMIMGFAIPGCCSKAGICAFDLSMAGLGCNQLPSLFSMFGGGAAMDAGPPQTCGAGQDGAAPATDAATDVASQ